VSWKIRALPFGTARACGSSEGIILFAYLTLASYPGKRDLRAVGYGRGALVISVAACDPPRSWQGLAQMAET